MSDLLRRAARDQHWQRRNEQSKRQSIRFD